MAKVPADSSENTTLIDDIQVEEVTAKDKMIQGSAWMTGGSIFSRLLGAVYIVPWMIWMGPDKLQANSLFASGYNIYSLFLIISVAGVPAAMSKQVAHYNALHQYRTGAKLFKNGLMLMLGTGILSAIILYFAAPLLDNGDPNTIPVIRSLSFPLVIIPVMSLMRGYFQGFQEMAPSAISQIFEQIARVIYMLGATFVIMKVLKGNYVDAVTQSTFAAFIGAVFGLLSLVIYYLRKHKEIAALSASSVDGPEVETLQLFKEIIVQAIPFILVNAGITIFQLVDQFTFFKMMDDFYIASRYKLNEYYALFALNANKLIMIVVSLASSMAVTAVPLLSTLHAKGEVKSLSLQISETIQLFFFVMIPSSLGMAAVSQPLYTVFYGYDSLGISILQFYCYVSILLGLFTVLGAMLQGLYQNRLAVFYLIVGLVIKIILQYPSIFLFGVFGPLVSTGLSFLLVTYLMLHSMNNLYHIQISRTIRRVLGIFMFSMLMFGIVTLIVKGAYLLVSPYSRGLSMVILIIAAGLGMVVYGYLVLKTRLADYILGDRAKGFRRRLRIS